MHNTTTRQTCYSRQWLGSNLLQRPN